MGNITAKDRTTLIGAVLITVLSLVLQYLHIIPVLMFVITAINLALLASVVGSATEQLGEKMGPGATGVLQSLLGNLPELFIAIFSLRAGLIVVVQSALIGSVLANNLLVLGASFLAGGLKNGVQRFSKDQPRMIASLMLLAVSAMIIPTLVYHLHTPASAHIEGLTIAVSIVLLVVFLCSIPVSLKGGSPTVPDELEQNHGPVWPVWLSSVVLILAGIGAAFVSDWFVESMKPAIKILHISEAFTGLVIVAIAGNAVENVVGIQLAVKNQMDYAISVILNSALQVALGLTPIIALLSFVIGGAHMTLVLPPLLVAALFLSSLVSTIIVYDGESIWLEGTALIGLYVIISAAFWWG